MKRYIRNRLLQLIPVLIGITLLTFLLMHVSSTDAVDVMEQQSGQVWTQEQKEAERHEIGLDQPLPQQYVRWLGNVLRGDMGTSYISGEPVSEKFFSKLQATLLLTGTSVLLTVILSVPLGILSAVRRNRFSDYLIRFLSFVGNSLPNFFVALLLIYFLALKLGWFPVMGTNAGWKSVILPTLTLTIAMASRYTRQVRACVLEELGKEYVTGARARGIHERKILFQNVLKNCLGTIVTLLALSIGSLLGGTAVVETIFMWDGVGKMAVDAVLNRDYPVIQAYVIWMALIYVCVNLSADIICGCLDPRVRTEKGAVHWKKKLRRRLPSENRKRKQGLSESD